MSHAREQCTLAALASQQRFLRQKEQQVRAELLRLSRSGPLEYPQYRPGSPPPPQKPIERRANYGSAFNRDVTTGVSETEDRGRLRNSELSKEQERQHTSSVALAIAQRQNELTLQQQERQRRLQLQQQLAPYPLASTGGGLGANGSYSQANSPYTFDSETHEGFPWVTRAKQQAQRVSPRHLPAAGMPSGSKRFGEEWIPSHQRRQVQMASAAAMDSHVMPTYVQRQNHPMHPGTLPSTLPPSLHPNTCTRDLFCSQLPLVEHLSRGNLGSRHLSCQHRASDATAADYDILVDGRGRRQQPEGLYEEQWPWRPAQQKERGDHMQFGRQKATFTAEIAAGKPSSQNDRETWGFRRSLRSSNEPKSSTRKVKVRNAAANCSVSKNPSFASTRAVLSDDEEILRKIGIRLSPRELLFFEKQRTLRGEEKRLNARRMKNHNAIDAAGAISVKIPARNKVHAGYASEVDGAFPGEQKDNLVRIIDTTQTWSLPSWMRAYGVSNQHMRYEHCSSVLPSAPYGVLPQTDNQEASAVSGQAHSNATAWRGMDGSVCGCRCCCRLKAAKRSRVEIPDKLCCCCPCCSSWQEERESAALFLRDSRDDGDCKGDESRSELICPSSHPDARSGCSRCGKMPLKLTGPKALSSACRQGLSTDKATSLCDACEMYLACECNQNVDELAMPLVAMGEAGDESNADISKMQLSPSRAQGPPVGGGDSIRPIPCSPPPCQQSAASKAVSEVLSASVGQQTCAAGSATSSSEQVEKGRTAGQGRLSNAVDAMTSGEQQSVEQIDKPHSYRSVWDNPRIVCKICQFLSLSKLLLVRRCNKTLLQAAQYRMRYVLYKSLLALMRQQPGSQEYPLMETKGQHCPLSAEALIQLLGLEQGEVDAVKAGNLPPPCPPEAETPRMEDVAASIRKTMTEVKTAESPAKANGSIEFPTQRKKAICSSEPMKNATKKRSSAVADHQLSTASSVMQQKMLLDAHLARLQAREEACLNAMRSERQFEHPTTFSYDEAAGPVAAPFTFPLAQSSVAISEEPSTFRRVRHSFLKLWNYDDEAFRRALVGSVSSSYPAWLYDVSVLLLRAVFQVCCNSLSAPPVKDLISLFAPKNRPSTHVDVPARSDSYLWAKMAYISGYAMHLVSDHTWPPLRDPVIRLVAQRVITAKALVGRAGVDDVTLQIAAAGNSGGGIAPLALRPAVVDSLELKMSKVPPEFIAEFVAYGKQQQQLHASNRQLPLRSVRRQLKTSQEMVLMMDMYEWLASVLTHLQQTCESAILRKTPSARTLAAHRYETRGLMQRPGAFEAVVHLVAIKRRRGSAAARAHRTCLT